MPIKILRVKGGAAPVVVCDYCGERIEDARLGNYEWVDPSEVGATADLLFLHKKCSAPNQRQNPVPLDSMELNVFVPYLAGNLSIDWDSASAHARIMAGEADEYGEDLQRAFPEHDVL